MGGPSRKPNTFLVIPGKPHPRSPELTQPGNRDSIHNGNNALCVMCFRFALMRRARWRVNFFLNGFKLTSPPANTPSLLRQRKQRKNNAKLLLSSPTIPLSMRITSKFLYMPSSLLKTKNRIFGHSTKLYINKAANKPFDYY